MFRAPTPPARPTRQRLARATGLVLVGAIALVGCSTSGGDEPEQPESPEAAGKYLHKVGNETLGVERVSMDTALRTAFQDQEFSLTSDGQFDFPATVGEVDVGLRQGDQQQRMVVRSDGEKVWFGQTQAGKPILPDGKRWLEGDVDDLKGASAIKAEGLLGVMLALLAADKAEVGDVETIDDVETRKFSTTVDYQDAIKAAGDRGEAFRSALRLSDEQKYGLAIDVWVGPDDIARKFRLDVETEAPLTASYDVDLADVDEKVEAPEAPQDDTVLRGPAADRILDQLSPG